jgi:hypothetical protein
MSDISGIKHDEEKRRFNLIPWDALDQVASVFTLGAKKYADRNWELGFDWGRLSSAAVRHISAWEQGIDNDEEWELPHLAHAICCLLMLLALVLRDTGRDNRAKKIELQREPEWNDEMEYTYRALRERGISDGLALNAVRYANSQRPE